MAETQLFVYPEATVGGTPNECDPTTAETQLFINPESTVKGTIEVSNGKRSIFYPIKHEKM